MVEKTRRGFNYSTKDYYGRVYSFSLTETETEILIEQIKGLYKDDLQDKEEINLTKNPQISTDAPEIKETVEDKPFITYLKLIEDIQNDLSLFPEEMRSGKPICFYIEENKIPILNKKPSQVLTEISNSTEGLETIKRSENRFRRVDEKDFYYSVKDNGNEMIYVFKTDQKGKNIKIKQERTQRTAEKGIPQTAEDSQVITLLTLIEDIQNKENLPKVLANAEKIYLNFADVNVNISQGRISEILTDILDLKEKNEAFLKSSKEMEERVGELERITAKREEAITEFNAAKARIDGKEQDEEMK